MEVKGTDIAIITIGGGILVGVTYLIYRQTRPKKIIISEIPQKPEAGIMELLSNPMGALIDPIGTIKKLIMPPKTYEVIGA